MNLEQLRRRGFLPETNPLQKLPPEYSAAEELQRTLPELFGTKHLRPYFEKTFPPLFEADLNKLAHAQKVALARNCLFGASAFINNHNEPPAKRIPRNLALLAVKVCDQLDVPPILSYNFYCLNNWRLIDKGAGFHPENLRLIQGFIQDESERWFVVIHTSIEWQAGSALAALVEAQAAAEKDNIILAKEKLWETADSLKKVVKILRRMPEGCRPEDYYRKVRPQIQLFTDVVYEGVEKFGSQPQSFRGETGAQSSVVPALIRFLGIKHQAQPLTVHLEEMIKYMPPEHRKFLKETPREAENGFSLVRNCVAKKMPDGLWEKNRIGVWRKFLCQGKNIEQLRGAYNDCVRLVYEFRNVHLNYAIDYIQKRTGDQTGTGGTPYMNWLTQMRDETLRFII